MGEVYRARDSRLGRDVALKGLPEGFAGDVERRARLDREARLLAALNHPHIGAIHAIEKGEDRPYLVLELIEGESLATRLERGALPPGEALEVARQIALAMEAAHENGIVHRDLKPGNVMIRRDGAVKVVDFGLATTAPAPDSDPRFSLSPTLTYAGGAVLGTAAYMSPEQARGRPTDRRTDVWAFGCLLFECLTGRQAFEGETASDVIARILEREPDASLLPTSVPPGIRRLIGRCLEKDPQRRLRDLGDARLEIEDALALRSASGRFLPAPEGGRRPPAAIVVIAVTLVAAIAGALGWSALAPRLAPAGAGVARVALVAPPSLEIGRILLTHDGGHVLMFGRERVAAGEKQPPFHAWARRLDEHDLHPLPGTEGIGNFQPTPDGNALLFLVPGTGPGARRLWKVALEGAAPAVAIADWDSGWGGIFALANGDVLALTGEGTGFVRLPAGGGRPEGPRAISGAPPRTRFGFAGHLSDNRHVLLNMISYGPRGWSYRVGVLDLATASVKTIVEDGGNASWWPGALLFARGDALLAAPFDSRRYELTGPPVGIAAGLRTNFEFIPGEYQLTADGTLACPPGGRTREQSQLGFLDHGRFTPWLDEGLAADGFPTFSRDGRRLLVAVANARGLDEIWMGALEDHRLDRVVGADADCSYPLWSGDGTRIAYSRNGSDALDGIYVHDLAGGSPDRRLTARDSLATTRPWAWSPDGRWLLLVRAVGGHPAILRLEVPATGMAPRPRPLFDSEIEAQQPSFSPDGRWLAFGVLDNARGEIAVCPFRPDGTTGPVTRVTRDGGFFAQWGDRGASLYFTSGNNRIRRVSVQLGAQPAFSSPEEVCDLEALGAVNWGLAPGNRILASRVRDPGLGPTAYVDLTLHWDRELARRLAEARASSGGR
jgi:hypothetical protein